MEPGGWPRRPRRRAVDPAGEMLKVAKMKAELAELKIEFHEVGGEDLPFEKASFNCVLAMGDVLSYAMEPEKVLKKIGEVLRKGGKLLASVDNAWAFLQDFLSLADYSMAQKLLDERKIPIGDRSVSNKSFLSRAYFPGEISGILRSNGFELVDMASLIAFYPTTKFRWRRTSPEPASGSTVIAGRKRPSPGPSTYSSVQSEVETWRRDVSNHRQ